MRHIDEIIIHCTATNSSWYEDRSVEDVVKEITRWHVEERGWSDCGYHAIIHRDGEVGMARPIERTGAHCRGNNKGTIGVSLVGGRGASADDLFDDTVPPRRAWSVPCLLDAYQARVPGITNVRGHNDYASNACPGFDVREWYNG